MFKLKKPDTARLIGGAKNVISKIGKRNLVIVLAVLLIGGAVWLNWALFSDMGDRTDASPAGSASEGSADKAGKSDGEGSLGDAAYTGSENEEKTLSDYFSATVINRQRARDEAVEVLQLIVDNTEALEESKQLAMENMAQIADDIAKEANIETLILAKGFENCVAVISDGCCSVIIKCDELLPSELAQIQEIVCSQAGILPEKVNIIKKS